MAQRRAARQSHLPGDPTTDALGGEAWDVVVGKRATDADDAVNAGMRSTLGSDQSLIVTPATPRGCMGDRTPVTLRSGHSRRSPSSAGPTRTGVGMHPDSTTFS